MTNTKVPGRLLAWTALLVALAASVAANVAFARPAWGPRLSSGVAPVLVVLAAGLLERVPLAGVRWWRRSLAYGGLGVVVVAAFVTSFEHQYRLLIAYGNGQVAALLLPIAVDGLIVLASVCLTVIAERRRELSTVDNSPMPAGVEAPPAPVEQPAEVSQVSDQTVSAPRRTPARRYTPSVRDKVAAYVTKNPDAEPAVIARKVRVTERTVRRHLADLAAAADVDGARVNGAEVPALVEVSA